MSSLYVALYYAIGEKLQFTTISDFNLFVKELGKTAAELNIKIPTKRLNLIKNSLAQIDENAEKVIKKIHKLGKVEANPLYGLFNTTIDGKQWIVEYEVDSNHRDTEQIPLLHEGGIERFFKDEVLSFAPDAWIDESKMQIGYEISFTKYFYKAVQLRTLDEIAADIKALESETDGLLYEIIGG